MKISLLTCLLTFYFGLSNTAYATEESFNITICLFTPITITEIGDGIAFPDTVAGATQNITVGTGDTGAATFNATGEPSASITASIADSSITITSDGDSITVDTFTVNPSSISFDEYGNVTGIKVGATAHVEAADPAGVYTGFATFRIVYI